MQVRDILRHKGTEVFKIDPDRTVHNAISKLNEHGVGSLLVVGEDTEILGIITERDILHECGERCVRLDVPAAEDSCPSLVRDVMTRDPVIGLLDDALEYIMGIMTKHRIRHLPILDEGKLAGIISIGDVVNTLLDSSEFENRMLRDYVAG